MTSDFNVYLLKGQDATTHRPFTLLELVGVIDSAFLAEQWYELCGTPNRLEIRISEDGVQYLNLEVLRLVALLYPEVDVVFPEEPAVLRILPGNSYLEARLIDTNLDVNPRGIVVSILDFTELLPD